MKKLFLLTLLVGFSKISYSSCFNDKEYKLISNYLTNGMMIIIKVLLIM